MLMIWEVDTHCHVCNLGVDLNWWLKSPFLGGFFIQKCIISSFLHIFPKSETSSCIPRYKSAYIHTKRLYEPFDMMKSDFAEETSPGF